PFGRPAGAQQGGYGRPAGGQAQGPYGRAAGQGQQGGGYNRPSQAGAQGGRLPQGGARSQGQGRARSAGAEMLPPIEKERVSNYDPNKKNYERQHDPEHVSRNKKQQSKQNSRFNGYDDEPIRGGKRARNKKPSAQQLMAPIKIETAYMAGDTITVRDLTEKIGKPAGEIIKKLFMLGNMATINSEIDFDTAQLVCSDFDITLERKQEQTAEAALVAEDFDDEEENLVPRPPVVTIMGHVDHGKTSLLDYIRKSRVTAGEAGGITQHIGAYTVSVEDGRKITFLDTPGHEAFTAMRARGAQATDIAVLVVAADDSVMPQTVESINHAKAAEVPVIVAINKMDKPAANPDRVKQDLTQYGLVCEDWGGETICVPVSALTGEGVDELLEMILLQADMLQLRANPNRLGRGVIIEAKLDKARGPLATVLVQNGTLRVGDSIIAGMASGRVRALINDRGERVQSAGPGMPVEIMGFDDVPSAGDEMIAVGDDHLSRQVADERREKLRASREATMAKMSMENLFSSIEAGKITTLNLIIKADVQGSVEAVKQAMEKLSSDEVKIRVLHSAAGAVTKDDVNLASAFNAIIIGFNIRPDASAREAAEKQKVDIRLYTVIYKAIEDMELAMKGLLAPEYREVLLGHAEVRNVFKITGAGIIAGCYVTDGKVQRNAQVRLLRDNVVVHEGKLSSLRHLKDDVKEMAAGYECGMSLEGHNDIKEGDVVECFIMEEIPR
ncbi:MAG: translation initiation factor IF-2, partial [Clostridia bacterium]|nr:translation initiation factor IF-2 [Clostridia bacterium]